MTIPAHKRISFKLATIGVLAAFLLGLVLSITQVLLDFLGQERELETRVRRILSVAERSAAQAVHNLDETLALEVVSGLLEYDFIVNARIIDDLDNELAVRESSLPRTSPTRWITRHISNEYQSYDLTLRKPGDNTVEYGNLSVMVDRDRAPGRVLRAIDLDHRHRSDAQPDLVPFVFRSVFTFWSASR